MSDMLCEKRVLDLQHQLFDAASALLPWKDVILKIQDIFSGSAACFCYEYENNTTQVIAGNCDPYYADLYQHEIVSHNILWRSMQQDKIGTIYTDQMILPKQQFKNSIFYNEWYRPQDEHSALNIKVAENQQGSGYFVINRGGLQPDFDQIDLQKMQYIAPILVQAAKLRQQFGELLLTQKGQNFDHANIGFVLTTAQGKLLYANQLAERFLTLANSPIWIKKGHITTVIAQQQKQLHQFMLNVSRIHHVLVGNQELILSNPLMPLLKFVVSVVPVYDQQTLSLPVNHSVVGIFIRQLGFDQTMSNHLKIQQLLGLSPKEALIASYLLNGQSLKEAAMQEEISITTARTHLARIFRKTNTYNQNQLIALLVQILSLSCFSS
ncbi:helix-turn-helix transcriptional regulator [Acinetobacter populi]|uniref:HTH luxR-type domain-containing protein n=1 Tax=Acinetobacter populi TaxID=1582270 RepID=A0A1Z9Z107_9GAMM|nr:helix-turn-helix transcriptional regulator [Acinetobacter populi]OUY08144.1 hypothetical protein CAP51_00535 [Acinetobacter populi]